MPFLESSSLFLYTYKKINVNNFFFFFKSLISWKSRYVLLFAKKKLELCKKNILEPKYLKSEKKN